nr:AAA family ATPase [Streptomyces boncukensis]
MNAGRPVPPGPTLLEREAELTAIEARLEELCGKPGDAAGIRSGGVIVFAGTAGAGKTTLLAEARRRALARGCTVLRACGGEQEQESAFHVVRQLVQPVLAAADEEEHRRILGSWYDIVAPAVGLVAPGSAGSPDPQGVRDGLDWLVTRFAVQYAPVVAIVDDAHWADAPSLAWLAGFAPRAVELPMLILTGYRPEDMPQDAAGFRRVVERDGTRPYELAPLSERAVARMVREGLGAEADTAFCHECWTVTGGSPFEVTELVARSYDSGLKPQPDNLPQLRELASAVKGEGFIEGLHRLGTSCVHLGWAVAVLGAEATLPLASDTAGLGIETATQAVARLREARILRAAPPGREPPLGRGADEEPPPGGDSGPLEFSHPLLATAVYRAIPDGLRTALHGQAASSVRAAGMGPTVAARHLLEVYPDGDPAVVEELREAAREYQRAGAPEAAHRCLGRALREPPSLEDRPRVLYELGCSALLNAPAATVNHLRAALEEPALTSELRVQVVYRLAQALGHADRMGEAVRMIESEYRKATGARTRLRMQAELLMRNAFRADEEDSPARSRRLARLASHLTGRGMAERYILGLRAWDAMVRGEPTDTALHFAGEALGSGLSWTDEEWGFEVPVLVALTYMYCDQPGRAEELFKAGIDECERKGWRGGHLSFGFTLLGYIRYRRGDLTEAENLVRAGLRIADRVGSRVPAQWFALGILIEILIARGRVDEAQRIAGDYSYGQVTPGAVIYPDSQTVYAELLLASGLREEAEAQLTAVGERLEPRGMRNPAWCPWQLRLAEALSTTEPERAARTAWEAVERARRFGAPSAIGRALHMSALVSTGATRLERLREAVRHLERSPAAYELACALVSLGAQLRRAGLPQDAADGLYRGLEGAVLCGAPALAARARDELAAAGLPPLQLRHDGTDALTAQERAAGEAAVRGMPVRGIAEELGLTEGAVRLLLSGVYRKLGTDPAGLPTRLRGG